MTTFLQGSKDTSADPEELWRVEWTKISEACELVEVGLDTSPENTTTAAKSFENKSENVRETVNQLRKRPKD